VQDRADQLGVPFLGAVPADDNVMEFDFSGKPLLDLENDSPVYQAVEDIMDQLLEI
jgi:CO dehydrogenase nickel-insertion accessory protein CooC1